MKALLLLSVVVCTFAYGGELGIELLPSGRPFRPTFADPREIKLALGFEGDSHMHASVGNYFSLVGFQPATTEPSWRMHFGLEGAGYFTMRSEGSRFPLETTDGLIGLYFEGDSGPWQAQFRFTHVSAHLSDGAGGAAIPYSRETAFLRVAYAPSGHMQVYGGIHYLAHTIPVLPRFGAQLGGSWFIPWGLNKLVPFVATDLQWKAEAPTNPSFNFQLGLAINNPPQAYRSFRFFYAYFTGADPRGQFLFRVYTAHSLGIEMQI